jgi:hypothetical protein
VLAGENREQSTDLTIGGNQPSLLIVREMRTNQPRILMVNMAGSADQRKEEAIKEYAKG